MTKNVPKTASLEIDERFLDQFNAMRSGWNYETGSAKEAGRLILHLFSRLRIDKYQENGGAGRWVLTVYGEEDEEVIADLRK